MRSSRGSIPVSRADRARVDRSIALLALTFGALTTIAACRRTNKLAPSSHDASTRDVASEDSANDAAAPVGPPNPWGDGSLPHSTSTGPEADRTLTAMTALRATIGFWRIARARRDQSPTLADLADTPSAAFDPATMRADAWGTPFEIECQGARVRVRSLGPDRTRDTPDDLWAQ